MTNSSTQSTDPVVSIARQLGAACTKLDALDAAAMLAAKDNNTQDHNRLRNRFDDQGKRVNEIASAVCFAQAETLEGVQAQLTIAASYAAQDFVWKTQIRAALASALIFVRGITGKHPVELGLRHYTVETPAEVAADLERLAGGGAP